MGYALRERGGTRVADLLDKGGKAAVLGVFLVLFLEAFSGGGGVSCISGMSGGLARSRLK